jgi:hypothetical protein
MNVIQNSLYLIPMVFLLSIANNALVELFHHSKLFKFIRDILMCLAIKCIRHRILFFFIRSYKCAFCLSYQFALIINIPFFNDYTYILCSLITARLSNLINDHSYPYLRTPR